MQDNILFGKLAYGEANAARTIGGLLREVIEQEGMYEAVIAAGLSTPAGMGGVMLSAAQQQKIAIARCVLKRPDILVLHESLAPLEGSDRLDVLKKLREEFKDRGAILSLKYPSMAQDFDHILVLRRGELVEQGTYGELIAKDGIYARLYKLQTDVK